MRRWVIRLLLIGLPVFEAAYSQVPDQDLLITNTIGMKLKLIPAGEFLRESEETHNDIVGLLLPPHRVRISQPYYLGTTEVTQGQWFSVMRTKPWADKSYVKEGAEYPAVFLSWKDAAEFCKRLSMRERREYRLPTEAEWELAARGGTTTIYSFGDDASQLGRYAWFESNAELAGEEYAHLVGRKLPNSFGLFDMHGNVWEWCHDRSAAFGTEPQVDPRGPETGSTRVFRGGCWRDNALASRTSRRGAFAQSYRHSLLGFRVALVVSRD